MGDRDVKGFPDESGKTNEFGFVVQMERVIHLVPVESGLLITLPRVHRVASGSQGQRVDRLAKGEVGSPEVNAQFNKCLRPQRLRDPECKWNMRHPRGVPDPVGPAETRFRDQEVWITVHGLSVENIDGETTIRGAGFWSPRQ